MKFPNVSKLLEKNLMSPFEILLGIVLSVLLASTIGFLFSRNSKQSEIVQKWKATQDSKKLSKKQMKIGALTVDDVVCFVLF